MMPCTVNVLDGRGKLKRGTLGPHTDEFYKAEPDELLTLDSCSPLNPKGKRPADAPPESIGSPKRRRTIKYKERNSNEFKVVDNSFPLCK
jgi:hypothetical protein